MDQAIYLGVDPGKNGGAALLDAQGGIIETWRWREGQDPLSSYNILLNYTRYKNIYSYIEHIKLFPTLPPPIILNTQALLVNLGQWHAVLDILQIPYQSIPPNDWQARYGLRHWRKRKAKLDADATSSTPKAHLPNSPLALAKLLWPNAPLKTQADDGVAVALLLADLARRDNQASNDRQAGLPLTTTSRRTKTKTTTTTRRR